MMSLKKREEILNKAAEIVKGARQEQYGEPEDCFGIIAQMWSAYLGEPVTSVDVAMMMVLLKVARVRNDYMNEDNYIDIAGYAACAGECR